MAHGSDAEHADQETTSRTVVGLFGERSRAEAAIRELKREGFTDEQIGMATEDRDDPRDSAATGAVSGGLLGGLIGLLGSLLIPGVGPIVVGGVLASTVAAAGVGAAAGGIIGALADMGVPEQDAQHFDRGLRSGATLVSVDAGPRTGEALALLEWHGMDFGPSGVARYGGSDRSAARGPFTGRDRRSRRDPAYGGPERRLAAARL